MAEERPPGSADLIPLRQRKMQSTDRNKPDSGVMCKVRLANEDFEGEVIDYFNDEQGIEHVRVKIKGSGTFVVRPTTAIIRQREER